MQDLIGVLGQASRPKPDDLEWEGGGRPLRHRISMVKRGRCRHSGGQSVIQSWTRRETLGLMRRLLVFLDDGFVVMMMAGAVE